MADHSSSDKGPLVVAGVALAVAIIAPLLVWTYARNGPELWGVPFFFWYQFLLVIVSVVLTSIAYRLVIRHERRRRRAAGLSVDGGDR
jgi:high-affinity Fe2+/Pb2+ permease